MAVVQSHAQLYIYQCYLAKGSTSASKICPLILDMHRVTQELLKLNSFHTLLGAILLHNGKPTSIRCPDTRVRTIGRLAAETME